MIEFFLKYSRKKLSSNIKNLLNELETLLLLENESIQSTEKEYYIDLKQLIDNKDYKKMCNIFFTIEKIKHKKIISMADKNNLRD
jgi:hypothetical protein